MMNINKIILVICGIGFIMLGIGLYFLSEHSNLIITWLKDYFPNITNLIVFVNSLSETKKAAPVIREIFLPPIIIFFEVIGLYLVYVGLKKAK